MRADPPTPEQRSTTAGITKATRTEIVAAWLEETLTELTLPDPAGTAGSADTVSTGRTRSCCRRGSRRRSANYLRLLSQAPWPDPQPTRSGWAKLDDLASFRVVKP